MKIKLASLLLSAGVFLAGTLANATIITSASQTPIDLALLQSPPKNLGTKQVPIGVEEKAFFDKLDPAERVTGTLLTPYSIHGKEGKYVSWFGIVREIEQDAKTNTTRLLIQHTYNDGATDTHMLTVSFSGDGDFGVEAKGTKLPLLPLRMVRVYGTVEKSADKIPQVKADFIKEWDWGNYNFMEYGKDHSNPEWTKLLKVDRKNIYDPMPKPKYYKERLGDAASSIYSTMTTDQCKKYINELGSAFDVIALKYAAPKYVGTTAKTANPPGQEAIPFVPAFKEAKDFLTFGSGHAGAKSVMESGHLAGLELGTPVAITGYTEFDDKYSAIYKIKPLSGKYKDEVLWLPGFALKP